MIAIFEGMTVLFVMKGQFLRLKNVYSRIPLVFTNIGIKFGYGYGSALPYKAACIFFLIPKPF